MESRVHTVERLDDLDARVEQLEEIAAKVESVLPLGGALVQGKGRGSIAREYRPGKDRQTGGKSQGEKSTTSTTPKERTPRFLVLPQATVVGETPAHRFATRLRRRLCRAEHVTYPYTSASTTTGSPYSYRTGHTTATETASGTPPTSAAIPPRRAETMSPT